MGPVTGLRLCTSQPGPSLIAAAQRFTRDLLLDLGCFCSPPWSLAAKLGFGVEGFTHFAGWHT